MSRQLDHLVRLIDDLLDVSRISRGLLELKRDHVDLGAIVRSAIEDARPWFEQRSQTISAEIPDGLAAFADETRVAQIITNLLHNASKFTPDGGSIGIELVNEPNAALVHVVDSGAGILPDQLERMFDMFARIERPGLAPQPGLGIGLALSKRLAEMHGGKLTASSQGEGRGATLTLRLPALPAAALPARVGVNAARMEGSALLNVVVVEDNEDVVEGLVEWLENRGHRVSVALNGKNGVEVIRDVRPDVVLCDLGLPDLDGLDVCRLVRALPGDAQPVMVALTGWGREEDVRRSKEAGFDHHLVKPPVLHKLEAILDDVGESK
jgi:CheY-like chemotaxis protein